MRFGKNLLFVFSFVFVFILVGVVNYFIDPYMFFNKNITDISTFNEPTKILYSFLKMHKDVKCETIVIGSSEASNIIGDNQESKVHYITSDKPLLLTNILDAFLDLHSEVKHVVLCFSPIYLFQAPDKEKSLYVLGKKNININDWYIALYSSEVMKKSFNKILNYFVSKDTLQNTGDEFVVRPNSIVYVGKPGLYIPKITQELYFEYVNNQLDIINSKNIKHTAVISPINAVYWGVLYLGNKEKYNAVNDFKRFLVNKFPFVYDFSLVTEDSSVSLLSEENIYWTDFAHFSKRYGNRYKNIILEDKIDKNVRYHKLTKDNIEEKLKEQEKLLLEYINNNSETVSYYLKISTGKFEKVDVDYAITRKIDK